MNLHQFRFVQEAARRGLNLTEVAKALHTSQPGVSKSILELEEELGVDLFSRHGKRLKRVTEPGERVLKSIDIIMREVNNIKRISEHFSQQDSGTLSIATTHTQARYVLPPSVAQLRQIYPAVTISLHQAEPNQVAKMVIDEVADLGMATESLARYPELVTLPCYEWQHMIVLPVNHPLAQVETLRLNDLVNQPLITYHPSFAGRTRVDQAFAAKQLTPNVVLEAIDSDVIKTYVHLGMGIGIIAEVALREALPAELVARPAGHLFGKNITRIAFKRGSYLRDFVYEFAQLVSPQLDRTSIEKAMNSHTPDGSGAP